MLFDAVGTLVRLREPVGETYARHFRAAGAALPASLVEDAFRRVLRGMPPMVFPGAADAAVPELERAWWRELVRRTLRAADGTARLADFDACFDALFRHYAGAAAFDAAPGAAAALDALAARGLRLAVLSNFDHRLPGLLESLGLSGRFERIVLPGAARAAKPDPAIFHFALAALGLPAASAVYVGDDPDDDHAAARAAGLEAVDVRSLATLADLDLALQRLEHDG